MSANTPKPSTSGEVVDLLAALQKSVTAAKNAAVQRATTPTPDRATLTDEERFLLVEAFDYSRSSSPTDWAEAHVAAVEKIVTDRLAAREQEGTANLLSTLEALADEFSQAARRYSDFPYGAYAEGSRDTYDSVEARMRETIRQIKETR